MCHLLLGDSGDSLLRAHWFFWPRKCWQNIDEYIAKNYNVYGSVHGIKTKHTCRFGESGIGRTSGGWKFPELTSLRSGGESDPRLTSLQVCLLWNQNLFVSKNMNGRVGGWKFSFSLTRHCSLFGYLSKWTPLSRRPLFCVFVVDIYMIGQLIFHSVYTCPGKHLNFGLLDIAFLWLLTSLSCHYEIIAMFEGDKCVVSLTLIYILLYINLL
jgi:hypothetical protein